MFRVRTTGSFNKTENFLRRVQNGSQFDVLAAQAKLGVDALSRATPRDSGETAASWTYEIKRTRGSAQIIWKNTHMAGDDSVAILLQYGHGTGTGGYVSGRDYINPAMKPVFDKIAENVWKEVQRNA